MTVFYCPKCKMKYSIEDKKIGTQVECQTCHSFLIVPNKEKEATITYAQYATEASSVVTEDKNQTMYKMKCPKCHYLYEFPSSDLGKEVICNHCQHIFTLSFNEQSTLRNNTSNFTLDDNDKVKSSIPLGMIIIILLSFIALMSIGFVVIPLEREKSVWYSTHQERLDRANQLFIEKEQMYNQITQYKREELASLDSKLYFTSFRINLLDTQRQNMEQQVLEYATKVADEEKLYQKKIDSLDRHKTTYKKQYEDLLQNAKKSFEEQRDFYLKEQDLFSERKKQLDDELLAYAKRIDANKNLANTDFSRYQDELEKKKRANDADLEAKIMFYNKQKTTIEKSVEEVQAKLKAEQDKYEKYIQELKSKKIVASRERDKNLSDFENSITQKTELMTSYNEKISKLQLELSSLAETIKLKTMEYTQSTLKETEVLQTIQKQKNALVDENKALILDLEKNKLEKNALLEELARLKEDKIKMNVKTEGRNEK